jgi:hypothetical protein
MHVRTLRRTALRLSILVVVLAVLTGCRAVQYSQQLKNTIEGYASKELLAPRSLGTTFAGFDFFGLSEGSPSVYYVYGWCLVAEVDRELRVVSANSLPVRFAIERRFFGYRVVTHEIPRSSEQFAEDVKAIFPVEYWQRVFDYPKSPSGLEKKVLDKARAYYR